MKGKNVKETSPACQAALGLWGLECSVFSFLHTRIVYSSSSVIKKHSTGDLFF